MYSLIFIVALEEIRVEGGEIGIQFEVLVGDKEKENINNLKKSRGNKPVSSENLGEFTHRLLLLPAKQLSIKLIAWQ